MSFIASLSPANRGIFYMVMSCLWAAMMGSLVRYCAELGLHGTEIVFYRNIVALVILLPWIMHHGGLSLLKTDRIGMYVLRAAMGLFAMFFWFHALIHVPLADATALSFTAPLFTAILAVFFFKERLGPHRITALLVGFLGVVIVLRPGTEVFQFDALAAVIAALGWSFSGIIIKSLTNTDDPKAVVFYMVLMMTPMAVPIVLPFLTVPTWEQVWWLIALGVVSNFFQISLSYSFAATELNVVMPFDFLRLVFISVIAYLVFDEVSDLWTFLGAAVILASAVYAAYRERLQEKRRQKEKKAQEEAA